VSLLTDGISDDIEEYQEFLKSTARSLRNKGIRSGKEWINRQLIAWPTPKHTDDKTIVVIQRN
jgi:serine/threonine protein phosphatase PrpC